MKRQLLCLCLCITTFLAGCGGREAHPIEAYIPGDENRSCRGLSVEISQLDHDMDILRPKTDKFAYNAICFVGGVLIIVPFFFMDLKNAEKVEYAAVQRRYNRLRALAVERNCDLLSGTEIPTSDSGETRRVKGYKVDTSRKDASGNFLTIPVYENEPKYLLKKDAAGEPVKDAKGNFIFEPVP